MDFTPDFEVFVSGIPRPQGSKTRNANGSMRESSKYVKAWRCAVTASADDAWRIPGKTGMDDIWLHKRPLDGPLALGVEFLFARPKTHFKRCVSVHMTAGFAAQCRNCQGTFRMLKSDAPVYFTSAPDLDKLHRAIQDSLEAAGVCRNDSQFVRYHDPVKRYANPGEQPGARIRVWRL